MTGVEYANKAFVPWAYLEELKALVKTRKEPYWVAVGAFVYGVAMGKRAERARRKGRAK